MRRKKPQTRKSERPVLPLERDRWSCVDGDGCITVSAFLTDYEGHHVSLSVWDNDDTGYERWTEHPTREAAEEAYALAVEVVTRAPNPLPWEWLRVHGLRGRR